VVTELTRPLHLSFPLTLVTENYVCGTQSHIKFMINFMSISVHVQTILSPCFHKYCSEIFANRPTVGKIGYLKYMVCI